MSTTRRSMMRTPRTLEELVANVHPEAVSAVAAVAETRATRNLGRESYGRSVVRALQATYDAAQTARENTRHWSEADALSANAANSPEVRRTLRNRARYEVANNSYARGIVNSIADYVIGTGPRLQLYGGNPEHNRLVEREFARWARSSRLAQKLWTARVSQAESGEAFAQLASNPVLASPVKLDVRLFEADQVASPMLGIARLTDPAAVDGIDFDRYGNPSRYHFLRRHPGDNGWASALDADPVDARHVLHLYRCERPGQARGIPEITACLPLFAMLRRYTLAVLIAAENAAAIGGLIKTQQSPEEAAEVEPLDQFDVDRGTWMALPEGWEALQLKAEQPTGTYGEFKREVLAEIARCVPMPYPIAAGDSSRSNYASGRLDHQAFYRRIEVDRETLEVSALDPILRAWWDEAARITGYLPQTMRGLERPDHAWFWQGLEHVDPGKEASASQTRVESGVSNLATECARAGQDWEEVMRQRAREQELARTLGVTYGAPPVQQVGPGGAKQDDAPQGDDE